MAHRPIVIITDEDAGRIAAIKNTMPNAQIMLCWWHKANNIRGHFLPAILASNKLAKAEPASPVTPSSSSSLSSASSEKSLPAATPSSLLSSTSTADSDDDSQGESLHDDADEIADEERDVDADITAPASVPDVTSNRWQTDSVALFNYMRSAPTFDATQKRLDAVIVKFPSCADYVNNHLRSTIYYWAKFACSWRLRFGLKASSIQEAMHGSIKQWMDLKSLMPHQLPEFLRLWAKRKLKRAVLKHLISDRNTMTILRGYLEKYGLSKVLLDLRANVSQEGEHLMLVEINNSASFCTPVLITERHVLEAALQHEVDQWGPDAMRFQILYENLLIEATEAGHFGEQAVNSNGLHFLSGSFFHIDTFANNQSGGLVFLHANGSFASSSGYFANYGFPDRLCWKLILAGLQAFNPKIHAHEMYYKSHTGDCCVDDLFSSRDKAPDVHLRNLDMPAGSYDWAIQFTETRWQVHACNRSTEVLKMTEHVQRQTVRKLSKKQQNKQMSHEVYDKLSDTSDAGERFRTALNAANAEYEEAKISMARLTLTSQRLTAQQLSETALSLCDKGQTGDNKRKEGSLEKKKKPPKKKKT
jgi:hypothetical protein